MTGKASYNEVSTRANKSVTPQMILIELCKTLNIRNRTTEAKTKLFFLICQQPQEVVFPKFEDKPKRSPVFSLSEKGLRTPCGSSERPRQLGTDAKIISKWDRAKLDVCVRTRRNHTLLTSRMMVRYHILLKLWFVEKDLFGM